MFEVHCDELIRGLSKRADTLCSKLLARMSKDHQEANKALCDEYEKIAEKALTTPANTEQLMELKEYIHKVCRRFVMSCEGAVEGGWDTHESTI